MKKRSTFWIGLILGCSPFVSLHAHEIWVEADQADKGLSLMQGHHRSDHAQDKAETFLDSHLSHLKCLDDKGFQEAVWQPKHLQVSSIPLPCSGHGIWVEFGWQPWTKTPYGTKNLPKSQVKQSIKAWESRKSLKYISSWNEVWLKPLGQGLELVPTENPLALSVGEKIRLVAYLDGKPLEGAIVTYDGKPRGTTSKDGHINLRVSHGDEQSLKASFRKAVEEPDLDERVDVTFLQFRLTEKP